MTSLSGTDTSEKTIRALKHFAAVLALGYPVSIIVLFWLRRPESFGALWIPDPNVHYLGTVMLLLMLASLAAGYALVILTANTIIALCRGGQTGIRSAFGWARIAAMWLGLYVLLSVAELIGLLGPMMITLSQSPVGKIFFGE